jgi:superfamily II DNA/RNA helicase
MPAERCAAPESSLTETAASFAELGVPAALVDVLDADGITAPFPVQAATLPDALAGRDILGRAQTGSGKTLGFALPMVSRLAGGSTASGRPRGLVLVPTRELASQVSDVLKPLARAMGLWVTTIYGGVSYGPQVNALQRKTDIVVATPGRLADLIGQGECDLSDVEITVIDEADQMADLGFLPIVRRLLDTTPASGQRMLFSATLDAAIDVLARRFLSDPVLHSVDENSSPAEIEHHVLTVDAASRVAVIATLAGGEKRSLVFTRTKHGAERLARQLTEAGIPAAELHGNLRQGARSRNLAAFASGIARVMVATDIAARGIHIDGIDLVIHADPPGEHKAYVHRSGRTARGGADGVVVTLQTKSQARDVTALMRKADITPHAAVAANAESDVLAEIAGPPAPRVSVAGKVSELVQPEDRLARNDRPGVGKPWEGRPRRDHKPRDERFRGRDDRTTRDDRGSRADRDRRDDRGRNDWRPRSGQGGYRPPGAARPGASGRPFGAGNRADSGTRPAYGDRGRDGWNRDDRGQGGRDDRNRDDRNRDGRPARDERSGRDDRPVRGEHAARPRSGTSSPLAGQAFRPLAGRGGRPQAGGNFTGSARRSGYSAGRGGRG